MWVATNSKGETVEIEALPFPDFISEYYKDFGMKELARLSGEPEKKISSYAVKHGYGISYRTKEEREEAKGIVAKAYNNPNAKPTNIRKMKLIANSESDLKHLARDAGVSKPYINRFEKFETQLIAALKEAAALNLPKMTYLQEHKTALFDDMMVAVDHKKKAISRMIIKLCKDHEIVSREAFWPKYAGRIADYICNHFFDGEENSYLHNMGEYDTCLWGELHNEHSKSEETILLIIKDVKRGRYDKHLSQESLIRLKLVRSPDE